MLLMEVIDWTIKYNGLSSRVGKPSVTYTIVWLSQLSSSQHQSSLQYTGEFENSLPLGQSYKVYPDSMPGVGN